VSDDGKTKTKMAMVAVSPGYSWVQYGGTINTANYKDFAYPTFREGKHVWIPICLMLVGVTVFFSCKKYANWLRRDDKVTRLGLASAHILLIISSILSAIIYLVASLVVFDDPMVFVGDWTGQMFGAFLNYYFVTVCLRFGEIKALEDAMRQTPGNSDSR